jgi:2'-hydroxyisoflavone reductase
LNILILGGTKFLGRHLVEESLKRGHEVSIFTRGQTNTELFPEVEKLIGNRDGDLESLKGRHWDAVIDTSGYIPRIVKDSAAILASSCNVYTFISSISVYSDFTKPGLNEEAEVGRLEDESVEKISGETYGPLKALCEQEVLNAFPDKHLIIRPGLIVGPYDPTDRFTYWPSRIGEGEEVLVPENQEVPVQFIDVRDLSSFIIQQLENKSIGTYHVTGPSEPISFGDFLSTCQSVVNPYATITTAEDSFLEENEVRFWSDLPLYIPTGKGMDGFQAININKALGAGLVVRPLEETIKDTYNWSVTRENEYEFQAGLSKEMEVKLLKKLTS